MNTEKSKLNAQGNGIIADVIKSLSSEFVDWKKVERDFYEYRNSFEGDPVITISSLLFFLEHNKLSPFAKRDNVL